VTGDAPRNDGVWLRAVEIRGDEFPDRMTYPFNISTLQSRQSLEFRECVSFFVGENGSGKSTLIEAIARRCGLHLWAEGRRRTAPTGGPRSSRPDGSGCGRS